MPGMSMEAASSVASGAYGKPRVMDIARCGIVSISNLHSSCNLSLLAELVPIAV